MKSVAAICFRHWLAQSNVLFIIGGKSNNTDIFETFRAMADALREHFAKHGPTPLFVVIGRGGPNLVRGMGVFRDTCEALGLPHRIFGFDSAMSEVVDYAREVNEWMKAGGREQIAAGWAFAQSRGSLTCGAGPGPIDRPGGPGARLYQIVNIDGDRHASARRRRLPVLRGISSLSQIATRHDRVCVLNILGGESSEVTPVSHVWSGGNVVFGTAPGKSGQTLETSIGPVPVFNSVREGLDAGHRFNCGVVTCRPPRRATVAELIRVNPELKKIFIITEKIAVHDAREIRAMGQQAGIDIFGANCLGVADA